MSRGSFKRSLPRGRHGLKASPALLGVVLFLVLLVPALFYLYPVAPDSRSNVPDGSESIASTSDLSESNSFNSSEPVLRIETLEASLLAKVKSSPGLSQIYLENTGSSKLHHLEVLSDGRTMGILSQLDPSEKKVLAVSGQLGDLNILALDQSGQIIEGSIEYSHPPLPASFSGSSTDIELDAKTLPEKQTAGSEIPDAGVPLLGALESPPSTDREDSLLSLVITANKSEGRSGDFVGYRCSAINNGPNELSDIQVNCAGKIASTKFLPKGKELYLEGSIAIEDNTEITASVQAKDAKDQFYTNNTSITIWKISPDVLLEVEAPNQVHRGDKIIFLIKVVNNGSSNLTEISVTDSFGEVGQIPFLKPSETKTIQKEREILEGIHDMVKVTAHDSGNREVYAGQNIDIRVLSSSLQIQSEPAEVRSYPGEPAEVTWILSNTGEEVLKNVTLDGNGKRCMLRELPPGKSVRMAAIYSKESTSLINVTAKGIDDGGYVAYANGSVLLTSIQSQISLKVMPSEIEVCPGETVDIRCLVTNSGDDTLTDVILTQDGSILATTGRLEPGEFRVVDTRTVISGNSTIRFEAVAKDSGGKTRSEGASVNVRTVVSAIKLLASASPPTVAPGGKTKITCTVINTGSVPLYSIFVISKQFGPLGNIDYLAPKRQMIVSAERSLNKSIDDQITAEGFTQDKKSARGSCRLNVLLMDLPGLDIEESISKEPVLEIPSHINMVESNLSCGNLSLPISLPDEKETITKVSKTMAKDVDRSAEASNNMVIDGISGMLSYVEKMLGMNGPNSASYAAGDLSAEGKEQLSASNDYELSIEGVKGSEHGLIKILDVSALPTQPAAGEQVKITVHIQAKEGIKSASVKYGLSDLPLTKQDMMGVDRVYDVPLRMESGNAVDGYWSAAIPGRGAGVYMALSIWMTDGMNVAEGGPYMIHWSTVNSKNEAAKSVARGNGMLFIEESSVKGRGEVSIKDTVQGAAMHYNEKMIGNGSISLETMRSIDRKSSTDSFMEKKDMVFTDGNLKGHQTVASPTFHGGLGASVTQRFNLSHVDKSETSGVSSTRYNNNTLDFKTDQAFDGTWILQTKYAKFSKKMKADQQYKGSFQTQKSIKFQDSGQK